MPLRHKELVLQFGELEPRLPSDFATRIEAVLAVGLDDFESPHYFGGTTEGDGTREFFVNTIDPRVTFDRLRPLLESTGLLSVVTAAHADDDGTYKVLWPPGGTFLAPPPTATGDQQLPALKTPPAWYRFIPAVPFALVALACLLGLLVPSAWRLRAGVGLGVTIILVAYVIIRLARSARQTS